MLRRRKLSLLSRSPVPTPLPRPKPRAHSHKQSWWMPFEGHMPNGQLGGVVPVDADGNTVQEYMHQLAGSVLNQAMPELMQQMGAADRNPIMQAASGLFQVFA